jgi:hypothetical protein
MRGLRIALALVALPALVALVWGGGILYWHVRSERAVRAWERETVIPGGNSPHAYETPEEATRLIQQAGCRALPSLIGALDSSQSAPFLAAATKEAVDLINGPGSTVLEDCDRREKRRADWMVAVEDPPALRASKCRKLREWWSAHGSEAHQWWKFWSARCAD